MHRLIDRNIEAFVNENLRAFPAVAILGPRQYGKFTLVKMLYKNSDAFLYLDHYIISSLRDCKFSFYRSAAGDELDLLIERGTRTIAVECKASSAPQVTKGFWSAIETTKPDKTYIVAPVSASYTFKDDVEVCGLSDFLKKVEL